MGLRCSRLAAAALLYFLTFDLVDGETPSSDQHGSCEDTLCWLGSHGPEAWDAEFFCARATVPGPVLLSASEALAEVVSVPRILRPGHGFPQPPFHPPRISR